MRYIRCYLQKKVANGVEVFIYSTFKAMSGTVGTGATAKQYSVTFWDGKPKEGQTSSGSVTMWLNGASPDEVELYREVYGAEAMFQIDADNNLMLVPLADYDLLPREEQNEVTDASVFA